MKNFPSGFPFGSGIGPASDGMEANNVQRERVPNMMDCLLADMREHSRRMQAEFEAIMREGAEALGETPLSDTGFRRREFRDREV